MKSLEAESKSVARELERVQQQLGDSTAREPIIQEQIQVSQIKYLFQEQLFALKKSQTCWKNFGLQ